MFSCKPHGLLNTPALKWASTNAIISFLLLKFTLSGALVPCSKTLKQCLDKRKRENLLLTELLISCGREYYIRAPMYWLFLSIARLSNYLGSCLSNVTPVVSLTYITYIRHVASMFRDSMLGEGCFSSIFTRTFHHDCFRAMLVGRKVICSPILVVQRA